MSVRARCRSPLGAWHTRRRRRLRPGDTDHLARTACTTGHPTGSFPAWRSGCSRRAHSAASTPSVQSGQASIAQGPKSRSVSTTAAAPASGSTHRNVPDCPKCPNVARASCARPSSAGTCRRGSRSRAPSRWASAAEAGQDAVQAGEGDAGGVVEGGGQARAPAARRRSARGRRRWTRLPPRASREPVAVMPSGTQTASCRYSANGMPAPRRRLAERVEAGVGVDPPGPGLGLHLALVEPEPRGVRGEVAQGGARRTRGRVPVDRALLHGDERGVGGEQLRHRGEAEHPRRLARRDGGVGASVTTAAADVVDRPVQHLAAARRRSGIAVHRDGRAADRGRVGPAEERDDLGDRGRGDRAGGEVVATSSCGWPGCRSRTAVRR